ncbi:hypothetical protein Tco_0308762 [Tanacetum coccineum]
MAKNFRWGLHKSIHDHDMCDTFTDVHQVADAAKPQLRNPSCRMKLYSPNVQTRGIRVETDISRPLSRIIIGVTIRKMTVRDLTGRAVVVTTVTTITTTTLVTTTGILVLDATKGTEVSNPTDLPTRVWICQISQEISQKRTRERMSDQEAKEIKAEARKIMPQPSTVNLQSQHHSL